MGVWIETATALQKYKEIQVTPFVGVWIETLLQRIDNMRAESHPSWVCGLKQNIFLPYAVCRGHTLRGCVD